MVFVAHGAVRLALINSRRAGADHEMRSSISCSCNRVAGGVRPTGVKISYVMIQATVAATTCRRGWCRFVVHSDLCHLSRSPQQLTRIIPYSRSFFFSFFSVLFVFCLKFFPNPKFINACTPGLHWCCLWIISLLYTVLLDEGRIQKMSHRKNY